MSNQTLPCRRQFITAAGGTAATLGLSATCFAQDTKTTSQRRSILRSVKWRMTKTHGSVLERFQLCKALGYDGMELISPTEISATEIRAASVQTGMPVHGVVDMRHWKVRLSSPDPETRAGGQQFLVRALRDAKSFGGDTVLLVPGKVTGDEENHDHVWKRSIVEIRKSIPVAARLGVRILVENVWNGFCETPDQLKDYIDEINSPWVGVYFDVGNAQKFAPGAQWIETLGPRIVKLDIKDWNPQDGFCKIGSGEVDWPAVTAALRKINFTGWSTAEVPGGDRERLQDIAQRMERALG